MSRTLDSYIASAVKRGPSPVAHLINRLAHDVKDYHLTYATEVAASLYKETTPDPGRAPHYHTALHVFTATVAALAPAEPNPWRIAVDLHTVTDPSFVTLDPPGKNFLSSIGDPNDDTVATAALKRALTTLVALARAYADHGDMGQQYVSFRMLVRAFEVLHTDEHKLAHALLSDDKSVDNRPPTA